MRFRERWHAFCSSTNLSCSCVCFHLHPGVAVTAEAALKRGLQELVWQSEGIDAYIKDSLELVRDLDGVLTTIKGNVAHIMELLNGFERTLMFERKVSVVPGPAQTPLLPVVVPLDPLLYYQTPLPAPDSTKGVNHHCRLPTVPKASIKCRPTISGSGCHQ